MRTLVLFALIAAAAFPAELKKDIPFADAGGLQLTLDASVPDGKGPFPAAILVHGGGFVRGDKQTYVPPLFAPVSQAGYAWFSINYRLAPQHPFPAAADDVEHAIDWVIAHAQEYKVDPKRIVLIAESAGASISSYVGFRSKKLAGMVLLYGVHDWITRLTGSLTMSEGAQQFYGVKKLDAFSAPILAKASGITYTSKSSPPVLLIHGTEDAQVPYPQSVQLCEHLQSIAVKCTLYTVQGGGHGMGGWEKDPKLGGWKPVLIEWLKALR